MQELMDHLKVHYRPTQSLEGKTFHCPTLGCTETFPSMQDLMAHMKVHYKPNRYFKCENCLLRFRTHRSLFKHLHVCSDTPPPPLGCSIGQKHRREPKKRLQIVPALLLPGVLGLRGGGTGPGLPSHVSPPGRGRPNACLAPRFPPQAAGLPLQSPWAPVPPGSPGLDPAVPFAPGPGARPGSLLPDFFPWEGSPGACGARSGGLPSPRATRAPAHPAPARRGPRGQGDPGGDPGAIPVLPCPPVLAGHSNNSRIVWEHTRGRYSCTQCPFSTASREEMTLHIEDHRKNPPPGRLEAEMDFGVGLASFHAKLPPEMENSLYSQL
ncbi:ZN414 protein, partial [Climacteris rufus]|nr:ZN414 protein [Climacteris rufus]